jgi:hypothetical protein
MFHHFLSTHSDSPIASLLLFRLHIHHRLLQKLVGAIILQHRPNHSAAWRKPECNEAVLELINAGGYVCQPQQVLQAIAEFKIELDERSKMAI